MRGDKSKERKIKYNGKDIFNPFFKGGVMKVNKFNQGDKVSLLKTWAK